MIYFILFIYLLITFLGSLIGSKIKDATPESYFLANRDLGTLSLFFTILATNFSAFYFLGFAGEGYRIGYAYYIMIAVGTGLAAIPILTLGTEVWKLGKKNGYITPAELIYGQTQSRSLSSIFSLVMILFTLPYLSLQIIGGGYILENLTQGDLSYQVSVVALTIFTIVYVVLGGMQSVARTDLKQGIIVFSLMFMAVVLVAKSLGGVETANKLAGEIKPDLLALEGVGEKYNPRTWFSFLVFWMFCVPMFPQLFMRFYIARDLKRLKKSTLLYAFIPIVISILPVMIGVWGHISFPDLSGKEIDQVLPMMLLEHTSEIFSALVMVGAIAAFMSTLDSQLLALSTMLTRDIYIPFFKKELDFKTEVFTGRVLVAVFAVIGMLIAFKPFDTIFDMGKMAFSGLATLFPVALFAIYGKIQRPVIALIGVFVSLSLLFAFYYNIIPKSLSLGFEYFMVLIVVSFGFSALACVKREQAT